MKTTTEDKESPIATTLPDVERMVLKEIERMRLMDGTLTPEMCRHLNTTEIVNILLSDRC